MSRAEQVILAALDRGPLFFETHAGNGWHMRLPPLNYKPGTKFHRRRKRYFRTMDVRRVIASGRAIQIENKLVKK